MQFYLNGNKVDITLEKKDTLRDVLTGFETESEKNNATIVQIILDEEIIPAEKLDNVFENPANDYDKIEISTVSEVDIVTAMKNLAIQLEAVCTGLQEVSVYLQSNKDTEVNTVLKNFANSFDTLCHLISLFSLFPETFSKFSIENATIDVFLKDFSPLLEEFEGALKSKDTVLIGDLAEYEIMPRLQNLIASIQNL